MADDKVRSLQAALKSMGYDPGALDGLDGPKTRAAAAASGGGAGVAKPTSQDLSWMIEARAVFGLHEKRDNAKLRAWLRSDKKTLGDPAALPWCGDFVETAIKRALPDEVFKGDLAVNPYWARNWVTFGAQINPTYGAVLVFSRGSSGHVGFAVGQDASCFYVLGGTQGDSVSVVRIERSRLLAARWPSTALLPASISLPTMTPAGIPKSTNEF